MDAVSRKNELHKIKTHNQPEMTGIPLRYRGETLKEEVYRIPLEYLIYNQYNGRIGTEVKSFEAQNHKIDPETAEGKKLIEKFLYDSKKDKNEKTLESLRISGQQRYGIVTADGVIVDGNRRAMLLNKLYNERVARSLKHDEVDHCKFFLAIILPEDAQRRDIQQLETIYQMGEDEKLDYNPIQKYLKCKDLKELEFEDKDIADFMNEKERQVKKWLSTLTLMEDYLDSYGYNNIYTRLEKTEDQFLNLETYLKSYNDKRGPADWSYDETDISELKDISFDYIRARYEGKEFREIANTGKEGSIFSRKTIWDTFRDNHAKVPADDISVQDLRRDNPNEDLSRLLSARDRDWEIKAKGQMEGNLKLHISKLDDIRDSAQPKILLEKALNALQLIDTNQESFYDDEIRELVMSISKTCWDMKKDLERRDKNGKDRD